jgi:hypothetical protein
MLWEMSSGRGSGKSVFIMEPVNQILNLVTEAVRPSKIAAACNILIALVTQQLTSAIHERDVPRSRVLATLEKKWQEEIEVWLPAWNKTPRRISIEFIHEMLRDSNLSDFDVTIEELGLYLLCFEKPFKDGEIYEAVCDIERTLHTKIRKVLMEAHREHSVDWWRKGVPSGVREECVIKWEKDKEYVEYPPYNYTTLGHLHEILKCNENTPLFKSRLPLSANGNEPNMELILRDLQKLMKIRNKVMHPIGAAPPTEEDFFFVTKMRAKFELTKWR